MMNRQGFSPSSFSEELCFSDERQATVRKMDCMTSYSGLKLDGLLRTEGIASSPLGNRIPLNSQMENGFPPSDYRANWGQNMNILLRKRVVGAERAVSCSLSAADHGIGARSNLNTDSASHLCDADKVNLLESQYENGLFSSSLSDLFTRNLKLASDNVGHAHSVADNGALTSHYEDDAAFESLEELEAKTIGNLLPDDDDLLSGVTDAFDNIVRLKNGEDGEDLDLFSSVGGLELGEDGSSQRKPELSDMNSNIRLAMSASSNDGEHPFGELPSRTLFVRNINSNIEDSELRMHFERYGEIRTLYTACKHRGFVMISYYDIRAACDTMKALQNKSLMHRKLDIHFSIPKENPSEEDVNQGALTVSNIDSSVSDDELRKRFGAYGEIKELRETSLGSGNRFIEFYDVRASETAFHALNLSDIAGKQIKLGRVQPGGSNRLLQPFSSKLEQEESGLVWQQHRSSSNLATGFSGLLSYGETAPRADGRIALGQHSTTGAPVTPVMDNILHPSVSSTISNSLPSLVRYNPPNHSSIVGSGYLQQNHQKFDLHGPTDLHPHSFPEFHDGLTNGLPFRSPNNISADMSPPMRELIGDHQFHRVDSNGHPIELTEVFCCSGNGCRHTPGHHFMWGNSYQTKPQAVMWPNSPSLVNGIGAAHPPQMHPITRAESSMLNGLLPLNSSHMGSAPSVNPSLWDRRHAYAGESPDASVFHPGSLGNMRISGNSPHPLDFVSHNMYPRAGGNCMNVAFPTKHIGLHPHHSRGMVFPARGPMHPMMSSFDSPGERTRSRRNDGSSSPADNKKQFELDIDRIGRGEDKRTTLMIKNIPNKYTSKMLLAAIDERHKGTYDFIYLPIDFKNKCNVGYAFINMTDPALIVPFYQAFNGKKWEKFNSEKVASLAYARIQGKAALIAHFQNSSLMNEDKRCRPILFHTDGPNAGDQVPFPAGTNIRPRAVKIKGSTSDENNESDHMSGCSSSGSGKDSD